MIAILEIKRWSIFMNSLLEEFTVTFLLQLAFLIPLTLPFSGTIVTCSIGEIRKAWYMIWVDENCFVDGF